MKVASPISEQPSKSVDNKPDTSHNPTSPGANKSFDSRKTGKGKSQRLVCGIKFPCSLLACLNNVHRELLYYRRRRLRVKVFVKVFKTSLFCNLTMIWFIFGMIIHIGPKFCAVPSPHPRSCHGQGHRLRIFMLKFMSKFLGPHYFFIWLTRASSGGLSCLTTALVFLILSMCCYY